MNAQYLVDLDRAAYQCASNNNGTDEIFHIKLATFKAAADWRDKYPDPEKEQMKALLQRLVEWNTANGSPKMIDKICEDTVELLNQLNQEYATTTPTDTALQKRSDIL